MQVSRLDIENFRGVEKSTLHFDGHALLIGGNNVGKSTVCEALDLVLGPERLNRFPPVEEFDFRNANYLSESGETCVPMRIEVLLTGLTEEIRTKCAPSLEFWDRSALRILEEGEIDAAGGPTVEPCLRLATVTHYDIEEDQFVAKTYFARWEGGDEADRRTVSPSVKRAVGFLYLRTIRTGSRALSLERGTLLDNILRIKEARKGMWEGIRNRLASLEPAIDHDATEPGPILEEIENRLAEYISPNGEGRSTRLFVSQLTREHMRKTISFFLTMGEGEAAVPFQQAGTGTLNTLVLALLTFIAELKKDNVIFAMEEPEIALPPHTQRRIVNYLMESTSQCFITSHSPYVIERFEPDGIIKLSRDGGGTLLGTTIKLPATMKAKNYRMNFRRAIAEAILGKGVIVGEGITEQDALLAAAQKMEESNSALFPLDVAGITVINADGDGNLEKLGAFFTEIGVPAYGFYDRKARTPAEIAALQASFQLSFEIPHTGAEHMLAQEVPIDLQWQFLEGLRDEPGEANYGIPATRPDDATTRQLGVACLKGLKGSGGAARLLSLCQVSELPHSLVGFLSAVYASHPKPQRHMLAPEAGETPDAPTGTDGASGSEGAAP